MVYLVIIFGLVIVFFAWAFRSGIKEREVQRQTLGDDEFLYDKLTGKKITIEEAEAGYTVTTDDIKRIKTDEEITENYIGFEREMELVVNGLKKEGYKINDQDIDFNARIGSSAILSKALNWSWAEEDIFELSAFNFLILSYVREKEHLGAWVAILVIETERTWGQYVATPSTELEQKLLLKTDESITGIKGYDIEKLRNGDGDPAFRVMLETIPPVSCTSFEVLDKYLLAICDFVPTHERMDEILNLYKELAAYRPIRVKKGY